MVRSELTMAELVKKELENQGISQAEFCRQVGVTPKHLSRVLSGQAIAKVAQLDYWLFALGKRFLIQIDSLEADDAG